MKICSQCQTRNPDTASYCMACGKELPEPMQQEPGEFNIAGLNLFMLSVLGSIALSLLLIVVFRLPVFFLAAFLPLLWYRKKSD